ncbi:MAG: DUF4250 domain-containing protein [Clostridia bacterium]|nr:DUF4250 domain-containing protein [Clostridia bacterium]
MAYCPTDAHMLLSLVNMKLRDQYASLSALCDDLSWDRAAVEEALQAIGYRYDEAENAFV